MKTHLLALVTAVAVGCGSSSPPATSGSGGSGGASTGTGGSATGTGGTGGASTGSGGSGGASTGTGGAATGTGGTTGTGGSGTGGAAPTDGSASDTPATSDGASESPIAGGLRGTQMDPGTDGDGRFNQPAPYTAPPETLMRAAGVPQGTTTAKVIYASKAAYPGLKFQYSIYVPAQYKPGKRAALMVFLDAPHYDGTDSYGFNVQTTFDNLIAKGDMPVTIAVFVDPGTPSGIYRRNTTDGPTYREPQYNTPNDKHARLLLDELLADEVFPKYDFVEDPDGWAIGGHSSGGVAAFMIAWFRPEKFHKVLTHNASFPPTQGQFPAQIAAMPAKPLRVYLNSGTMDLNGWLPANDQAAMNFMAKGYHYRYMRGTGTHDPPNAGLADFVSALRWLWRGYKLPWY